MFVAPQVATLPSHFPTAAQSGSAYVRLDGHAALARWDWGGVEKASASGTYAAWRHAPSAPAKGTRPAARLHTQRFPKLFCPWRSLGGLFRPPAWQGNREMDIIGPKSVSVTALVGHDGRPGQRWTDPACSAR